ncbi:MAG: delta-60 repeat domain-containing protein [Bacteroidota bacterium]
MKNQLILLTILFNSFFASSQKKLVDTTFNVGSGFDNRVLAIESQRDGKILVGGQFESFNGVKRNGIARLNNDGSLDLSFKTQFTFSTNTHVIAIQDDGKILIGGLFGHPNIMYKPNEFNPCNIVRLNTDGSTDTSFITRRGYKNPHVGAICIQADGKILIGGNFDQFNGKKCNHLVRLNPNGSVDTTFRILEKHAKIVSYIKLQKDGKIITSGSPKSYDYDRNKTIQKFYPDGTIDSTFNVGRRFRSGGYIALLENNQIIASGGINPRDTLAVCLLTRLNNDGSTDTNFTAPRGFSNVVNKFVFQSDGKIIIAGDFSRIGEPKTKYMGLARLNKDGSIDSTFNKDNEFTINVTVALMPDNNSIIVSGDEGKFPVQYELKNIGRKYISRIILENKSKQKKKLK